MAKDVTDITNYRLHVIYSMNSFIVIISFVFLEFIVFFTFTLSYEFCHLGVVSEIDSVPVKMV